jgi:hypothetical protein
VLLVKANKMASPQMDIVRRAYALWQEAGEPEDRDWELYLQAEKELWENTGMTSDRNRLIYNGAARDTSGRMHQLPG